MYTYYIKIFCQELFYKYILYENYIEFNSRKIINK